jgi:hemerythrin-like domain-containing protein
MHATDVLKDEHRVIEQVLNCLEQMAFQCLVEAKLDRADARQVIDFFQTFADKCHHGKEEAHLFPLMESRGFSREHGPTGVMLLEHEEGRGYLRDMAATVDAAAAGGPSALRQFAKEAGCYVTMLRQHIRKEDQRLFPMADHHLTAEDQAALLEAFADVESREMHAGTHEKYLQIASDLADRYGVSHSAVESVASHGRCSCAH